jgi:hypothetical protein
MFLFFLGCMLEFSSESKCLPFVARDVSIVILDFSILLFRLKDQIYFQSNKIICRYLVVISF